MTVEKLKDGRERWHLDDGRTVTTSVSSVRTMDETVKVYAGALKRLAKE